MDSAIRGSRFGRRKGTRTSSIFALIGVLVLRPRSPKKGAFLLSRCLQFADSAPNGAEMGAEPGRRFRPILSISVANF